MTETTRDLLLRAAVDALIDPGGGEITTGRLATRAGVVQSAFYNHFASVEECKQAALAEVREQALRSVESYLADVTGSGRTNPDDLERLIGKILRHARHDDSLVLLFVARQQTPELASTVTEVLAVVRSEMAQTILRNAPSGSAMTATEAEIASRFALGVILSGIAHVRDGASPGSIAPACAAFLRAGVSSLHALDNTPQPF